MRHRTIMLLALLTLGASLALAGSALGKPGQPRVKPTAAPEQAQGVVNINTGTEEQLRLLPGIGPSKAAAILRYRGKRKFNATHELIHVRGIGRKTLRKLRPYLTVNGPTTLTQRPRISTQPR